MKDSPEVWLIEEERTSAEEVESFPIRRDFTLRKGKKCRKTDFRSC